LLASEIGASMIVRYDLTNDLFVPYIDGGGGEDFDIENMEGYIAVLSDSFYGPFSGLTHENMMDLEEGLNFITMPLDPGGEYHAREFCEELESSLIIRYNRVTERFQSFIPEFHDGNGFAIRGGEGFLASIDRAHTAHFYGAGWLGARTEVPGEYLAAAEESVTDERTPIIGISGTLRQKAWGEEVPLAPEYHAAVVNRRTGERASAHIDYATGAFAAVLIDVSNTHYVSAGDTLSLVVMDGDNRPVGEPTEHIVTVEDIERYQVSLGAALAGLTPAVSQLYQNYPNPFNPTTTIRFQIADPGMVSLKIFNVAGQLVRTLVNEPVKAGYYEIPWNGINNNGHNVASGVYFYRLDTPGYSRALKMVILR
jgi:hypothetical protein